MAWVDEHTAHAIRLLEAHRSANEAGPSGSPGRLRRKSKEGVYTYKEVNDVLSEIVDQDGSGGLVKALVDLGADINFARRKSTSLWKKVTQKNQAPERSGLLQRAASLRRPDVVEALAAHADQQNLNEALHLAIGRGELGVVRVLLARGADPTDLHEDFAQAVIREDRDLVAVLLSGARLPCLPCRSAGLLIALRNDDYDTMKLLVGRSADVNYHGAEALVEAVDSKKTRFVTLLVTGPSPPSAESLDIAVGTAYEGLAGKDSKLGIEMLDACIRAGAGGPETESLFTDGLVATVRRRQSALLRILLRHRRPADPHHTLAIAEAIRGHQMNALKMLLNHGPSETALASGLSHAMSIKDGSVRLDFVQLLLATGAHGRAVAEALIHAVRLLVRGSSITRSQADTSETELFHLLLHNAQADVNYNQGEALRIAMRADMTNLARKILDKQPSQQTLEGALLVAMDIQNSSQMLAMADVVLRTGLRGNVVDRCLTDAVKRGSNSIDLVTLLLTRASVNFNRGEALAAAVQNQDLRSIRLIMVHAPDAPALSSAVHAALDLPWTDRQTYVKELLPSLQAGHVSEALKKLATEPDHDLPLFKVLLDAGATLNYKDDFCLRHAALHFDNDLLGLVASYDGVDEKRYTPILEALVQQGLPWNTTSSFDTVYTILDHGASGGTLDHALLHVIRSLSADKHNRYLTELAKELLDHGADANAEHGGAAVLAAEAALNQVLGWMLQAGLATQSALLAFTAGIRAGYGEELAAELIEVFLQNDIKGVFKSGYPEGTCVHFIISSYPSSTLLVKKLLEAGSDFEETASREVLAEYDQDRRETENFGEEAVPVLLWSLLYPNKGISSAVIEEIIDSGVNPSFTTARSQTTPLLIAAKQGRPDVVKKLLQSGVKPSARDALGRSALFYASRAGDETSVALLLQEKVPLDDGSIHEASRGFHVDVMQQLIDAGHRPDFRSTRHHGRTALGEMALRGVIPDDFDRAESAVDLVGAEADPLIQAHGKSVIFLALDNDNADRMATLLLDRILWKTLNDEANVFREGDLHYSPTMYVKKELFRGPRYQAEALLRLLRGQGAVDRYYATIELDQPADAVGLPHEIREFEKEKRAWQLRRQREEDDHQTELRRRAEQARQRALISADEHLADLERTDAAASLRRRNKGLDHTQDVQMETEKHHNWANIRLSEAATKSTVDWNHHRDQRGMQEDTYQQGLRHRRELHHQTAWEDEEKHVLASRIREDRHVQRHRHRDDQQGQRLQYAYAGDQRRLALEEQKGRQRLVMQRLLGEDETRHAVQRDAVRARADLRALEGRHAAARADGHAHQMRMAEMEAERMRMVGEVNLREWKTWKMGQGQGQLQLPPQTGMIEGS